MRSIIPTLLAAFLLCFSTATADYDFRKFPYTIECQPPRRPVNRFELHQEATNTLKDFKDKPFLPHAKDADNPGNCAEMSLPMYRAALKVNRLVIYYAYDEPKNIVYYCYGDVSLKQTEDYFWCVDNYEQHSWGADVPPGSSPPPHSGHKPPRRAMRAMRA